MNSVLSPSHPRPDPARYTKSISFMHVAPRPVPVVDHDVCEGIKYLRPKLRKTMQNNQSRNRKADPQEAKTGKTCIGVNIGAITVKVVALQDGDVFSSVVTHQGRPMEALAEMLAEEGVRQRRLFRGVRQPGPHHRGCRHRAGLELTRGAISMPSLRWAASPSWSIS